MTWLVLQVSCLVATACWLGLGYVGFILIRSVECMEIGESSREVDPATILITLGGPLSWLIAAAAISRVPWGRG